MKLGKNKNIEIYPLRLGILIFTVVGFITLYSHIVEIHPRGPDEEMILQSEAERQVRQWIYEQDIKNTEDKKIIERHVEENEKLINDIHQERAERQKEST